MLATLGLTACNQDIHAKPSDHDNDLITFSDDADIYNNIVELIEDAYRDSSLAADVLNEVLYQYSVSVFGRYNRVAAPYNLGEDEITLKEAAYSILHGDKTVANTFIKSHKAYWTVNDDGERINEKGEVVDKDAAPIESEYERVVEKWNTIEDRIAIKMYNDIIGGTYSDRGVFSEKKYLASLRSGLNKVADYKTATTKEDIEFSPDIEDVEVFDIMEGYLTRDNYQTMYGIGEKENKDAEIRYVEDKIIPEIYRTLLVEQYLINESYNTLGRSYARKVNILSLTKKSDHDGVTNLMKNFVKDNFSAKGDTVTLDDFKAVSDAYKGVDLDAEQEGWLEAAGFEAKTLGAETYYVGTEYGDMMTEYAKISDDILVTDSTIESDFTGSYTYSKETGKEIKTREIKAKDHTENGWYIKNGGLTNLPDSIRSRLFNIGVANSVKEDTKDRFEDGFVAEEESKYVAKINGAYYLKVSSKENIAADYEDILFYDAASSTYYIIQIEEAISASKLVKGSDAEETGALLTSREEIINEVAKVISSDDSYKTLSTKHWLEEMNLKYHDTVVYEYFKTNYPELFEDEK